MNIKKKKTVAESYVSVFTQVAENMSAEPC